MKRVPLTKHFAIAALALAAAAGAGAKTLVFCSEGSPEKLLPGVNTTGTSFDANEPIYNRIVEFERARHQGGARPGRALGHLGRRPDLHLPPAQGREVAQPARVQAQSRDFNADDVVFAFRAPVEGGGPVLQGDELQTTPTSTTWAMPKLLKSVEKVDDLTVRITLNKPEAPFLSNLAMPYAAHPVQGIRGRDAAGRARPRRSTRSRSAPARSTWCSTRRTR
jgi:dipeptide transport system substrate-binding protein